MKDFHIEELDLNFSEFESVKPKIETLYCVGNRDLLKKRKVSIVGTRRPMGYTMNLLNTLVLELQKRDIVVVSGGAMGVDIASHRFAKSNTIMVSPSSLDIIYPSTNSQDIRYIYQNGLAISEYEKGFKPQRYSFVQRNRINVALGELLIIAEADLNSGSLTSADYAEKFGKEIYVFPHRINESMGTNNLVKEGKAKVIYDIESFATDKFGDPLKKEDMSDEVLLFCKNNPSLDEAIAKFGDKIYSYELEGKIVIDNLNIRINS